MGEGRMGVKMMSNSLEKTIGDLLRNKRLDPIDCRILYRRINL